MSAEVIDFLVFFLVGVVAGTLLYDIARRIGDREK